MDDLDRRIIEALLERERTIHQLSKLLYKTEDQYALRGHNSTLRYRLGRLAEDGLVRKRDGRHGAYHVPLDKITYGKAKLTVRGRGGSLEVELGDVLYTEANGRRQIVFLQ